MPPKDKVPPKKKKKVKTYRYYGYCERLTDNSSSEEERQHSRARGLARQRAIYSIARPRPPVVPAVVAPVVPAVIEPESEEDTKPTAKQP
jgi:hypothetical protein